VYCRGKGGGGGRGAAFFREKHGAGERCCIVEGGREEPSMSQRTSDIREGRSRSTAVVLFG